MGIILRRFYWEQGCVLMTKVALQRDTRYGRLMLTQCHPAASPSVVLPSHSLLFLNRPAHFCSIHIVPKLHPVHPAGNQRVGSTCSIIVGTLSETLVMDPVISSFWGFPPLQKFTMRFQLRLNSQLSVRVQIA